MVAVSIVPLTYEDSSTLYFPVNEPILLKKSHFFLVGVHYHANKIFENLLIIKEKIKKIFLITLADFIGTISFATMMRNAPSANSVFSARLLRTIYCTVTIPTVLFQYLLIEVLAPLKVVFHPAVPKYLAVGVSEELVFRGVIQTVLLRKLPEMVLRKTYPQHVKLVDHKITKIARVIFTAVLFALAHASNMGHFKGLLGAQFFGGAVFGAIAELSTSRKECCTALAELSLVHCFYDLAVSAVFK